LPIIFFSEGERRRRTSLPLTDRRRKTATFASSPPRGGRGNSAEVRKRVPGREKEKIQKKRRVLKERDVSGKKIDVYYFHPPRGGRGSLLLSGNGEKKKKGRSDPVTYVFLKKAYLDYYWQSRKREREKPHWRSPSDDWPRTPFVKEKKGRRVPLAR